MQGKLSPVVVNSYQPLREIVCEVLRDAIRGGVLKPGEWLKENDLADELLVSRTPVREAIRKLEQEGYVVTVPRRGAYVASVSIRDINEIFEIRAALEVLACELAAERITEEEQERLERLLVAIGRAIEEHDMERIVQTDIEFHELLYQAARNERLLTIIGNLREQLTRFRTISMSYPGRLKATLEEHRSLVDAIGSGDARRARKMAAKHMENSEQTLLCAIEEQTEWQRCRIGSDGKKEACHVGFYNGDTGSGQGNAHEIEAAEGAAPRSRKTDAAACH